MEELLHDKSLMKSTLELRLSELRAFEAEALRLQHAEARELSSDWEAMVVTLADRLSEYEKTVISEVEVAHDAIHVKYGIYKDACELFTTQLTENRFEHPTMMTMVAMVVYIKV